MSHIITMLATAKHIITKPNKNNNDENKNNPHYNREGLVRTQTQHIKKSTQLLIDAGYLGLNVVIQNWITCKRPVGCIDGQGGNVVFPVPTNP
jgi:hypothetical protein